MLLHAHRAGAGVHDDRVIAALAVVGGLHQRGGDGLGHLLRFLGHALAGEHLAAAELVEAFRQARRVAGTLQQFHDDFRQRGFVGRVGAEDAPAAGREINYRIASAVPGDTASHNFLCRQLAGQRHAALPRTAREAADQVVADHGGNRVADGQADA